MLAFNGETDAIYQKTAAAAAHNRREEAIYTLAELSRQAFYCPKQ